MLKLKRASLVVNVTNNRLLYEMPQLMKNMIIMIKFNGAKYVADLTSRFSDKVTF
jgi:hypothetical protein